MSAWQVCYDQNSGLPYYWNIYTNETTWSTNFYDQQKMESLYPPGLEPVEVKQNKSASTKEVLSNVGEKLSGKNNLIENNIEETKSTSNEHVDSENENSTVPIPTSDKQNNSNFFKNEEIFINPVATSLASSILSLAKPPSNESPTSTASQTTIVKELDFIKNTKSVDTKIQDLITYLENIAKETDNNWVSPDVSMKSVDKIEDKECTDINQEINTLKEKFLFLGFNESQLSDVLVLAIEFHLRLKDWNAGGLNSTFFYEKLNETSIKLKNYERKCISEPWICQWNSLEKKYEYFNTITKQITAHVSLIKQEVISEVPPLPPTPFIESDQRSPHHSTSHSLLSKGVKRNEVVDLSSEGYNKDSLTNCIDGSNGMKKIDGIEKEKRPFVDPSRLGVLKNQKKDEEKTKKKTSFKSTNSSLPNINSLIDKWTNG